VNVLVTGAGGFVCSNVVDVLLTTGHRIIAVDRSFDEALVERWGGGVELLTCDVSALPDIRVDAVIHGAAITASPEQSGQTPEANLHANIDPLLMMTEWARRNGAGRTILISSGAVFSTSAAQALTEETPTNPSGVYAVAKQFMEALASTLRSEYSQDVVAVRFGNIYGPSELPRPTRPRVSAVAHMIHDALTERRIVVPEPDPARDWTYAPDIGRALLALLEAPTINYPLYHVSSAHPVTLGQIAALLQEMLPGVRAETESDSKLSKRLGYLSNTRLRADIGFDDWTPLENGLRQTVAWMGVTL
jgi:UDP-glucose 4-epimerase